MTRWPSRRWRSSTRSASGRSTCTCCTRSRSRSAGARSSSRRPATTATTIDHPNNLFTLLLNAKELAELLLLAVPAVVVVGGVAVGLIAGEVPWGALVSGAICGYVLVGVYEWTHYLIHTAYRPKSAAYRRIWRNHRLHHFKNEHYWHGITNTLADRVLGTDPDQREVPRSATARTLDPGRAG